MSLEDLRNNVRSMLEGVEKHDELIRASKSATDKKQLKKITQELEKTKDFVLKLSKTLIKSIEHERRKIKA